MILKMYFVISGTVDAPPEDYTILLASVGAGAAFLLLLVCLLCHRKRRRRRRAHRPLPSAGSVLAAAGGSRSGTLTSIHPPPPPPHVCDELGERFASVDSVWHRPMSRRQRFAQILFSPLSHLYNSCSCAQIYFSIALLDCCRSTAASKRWARSPKLLYIITRDLSSE